MLTKEDKAWMAKALYIFGSYLVLAVNGDLGFWQSNAKEFLKTIENIKEE